MQDQEIHDLKSKMDEMAEEFGEMLRVRPVVYFVICLHCDVVAVAGTVNCWVYVPCRFA